MKKNVPWIRLWRLLPQNQWILGFTVIVVAVLCITANNVSAQQGAVSQKQSLHGKVVDEAGKTLQGVSVKLKATNQGVVTDDKGEYNISIPASGTRVLQFSYVGMELLEVSIGTQKELNVSLITAVTESQEVVVVGYGTQKRQAITGAVVQADLKTYDKVPVNNIMETLKGTVAGLNVGEANTAGGVAGYTIRGTNTIAASTTPLVVLDGTIFSGSLADISPADIESVTVLKDASAAAV